MVANVGCLELEPGAPNVIPGRASIVVEFRACETASLDAAAAGLRALAQRMTAEEDCTFVMERISRKPVIRFDPRMCEAVERSLPRTGRPMGSMMSYAGHDASVLGLNVPTGMVFVPSTGGISHAPEESTPPRTSSSSAARRCLRRSWRSTAPVPRPPPPLTSDRGALPTGRRRPYGPAVLAESGQGNV